ncbi:hypothetical protein ACOWOT_02610 [Helicobacter pylori]|uniref:hypothetical protein n=1 Tax=Helicobacter pylori TaxID=210 RepID=UPI001375D1D6|nr:hypothetical protein [Helicobacter pylori]WQS75221.1 hypothetical protein KVE54_03195 [Helicobacter pylori]WRC90795.1 hypothetical protein E5K81_04770 [Helicobacter pylori]WRG52228.1 hypothetical protein FNE09_04885 [Helicobacter pylori]
MSQFKGAKREIASFLLKECGFEYNTGKRLSCELSKLDPIKNYPLMVVSMNYELHRL